MHEIQRHIITALRYKPGAKFSELSLEGVDSNKLTYHLQELLKQELIERRDSEYFLTHQGKRQLNYLCDVTAKRRKRPVPVAVILPLDGDKILMQERLKEPWYGYWLLVAGKVELGESLLDAARRELHEETKLVGVPQLLGIVDYQVFMKNEITYHVHMFCYTVHNVSGQLQEQFKEGKNKWFDVADVEQLKIHPLDRMVFRKRKETGWFLERKDFFDGETLVKTEVRDLTTGKVI